jgi:multidrug efflux system membrane fusion protein
MAVINQLHPIYVDFSMPEQYLGRIRRRMADETLKVAVTIPEDGSHSAEGELAVVNNTVDSTTGTIMLRARFSNQDEALWPGQFVNVAVRLKTIVNAVVIPSQAVQLGQDGRYVFVVKSDMTVEMRPVATGTTYGRDVIVEKGLKPRERVVITGQLRLVDNARVEIKEEEPSKAMAGAP